MRFVLKLSSLTVLLLSILAGGTLFWVSQQVQETEREQRHLLQIVAQEEEAIRVLNAEWDYLNRPDRLETMAQTYLRMTPTGPADLLREVSAIPEPIKVPTPPRGRPVFVEASAPVIKKPAPAKADIVRAPVPVEEEQSFENLLDSLQGERR